MATATIQLMTAEEFYEFCHRPENRDRLFELERGEVVEVPRPGIRHGVTCSNANWILGSFVRQRKKGYVVANDAGLIVERDPDTVYGPDLFLYDEVDRFEELNVRHDERPPKLVVEVLSPHDRLGKVMRRVGRFLAMGAELVWIVDPEARNITAYRAGEGPRIFEEGEEITGMDVFPDLRIPVQAFFEMPGEHSPEANS